jgi:hypothetical protein
MRKRNVLLKLTDWQAEVLDYISHKTGMNYTDICRGALNYYIEKKLTGIDYKTVESVMDRALWDAWEEWDIINNRFDEMEPKTIRNIQMITWEYLKLLKNTKRVPTQGAIMKTTGMFDFFGLTKFFNIFLECQWRLFEIYDLIPIDNQDKLFEKGEIKNKTEYYDRKWKQYGEILTEKTKHMRDPKLKKLDDLKRKFGFITERELNLFLIERLDQEKIVRIALEEMANYFQETIDAEKNYFDKETVKFAKEQLKEVRKMQDELREVMEEKKKDAKKKSNE